jgi:hypothetical protein
MLSLIAGSFENVLKVRGLLTIHSSVVEFCSTTQGLGAYLFSMVKVRKTTTKKQKIPIIETYERNY